MRVGLIGLDGGRMDMWDAFVNIVDLKYAGWETMNWK